MPIFTPGSWDSKNKASSGFTLFELLIALTIVGIMVTLATMGISNLLDAGLKKSSNELAGVIRYLRTKSVIENKYHRLTLDFETSQYLIEESSEPFVIATPKEEVAPTKTADQEEASPESSFTASEDRYLKSKKLGNGVFFKNVLLAHQEVPVTEGKAELYFFPDGYALPAIINLRDEDDESFFSLEVYPMTGKVKIEGIYREFDR